jgi:hypothetical protein
MFHAYVKQFYDYPGEYTRIDAPWDAGQQAISCALADGYVNQDWFGFDYSSDFSGTFKTDPYATLSHAGPHHGRRSQLLYVSASNTLYETTETHLSACFVLEKFIAKHPEMNIQIYSDTLLLNFIEARMKFNKIYTMQRPPVPSGRTTGFSEYTKQVMVKAA